MSSDDVTSVIAAINLYAFAVDSQRWALFDKVFTTDVRADYGGGAVWTDLEALKRDFDTIHAPFEVTQHTTTNHVVVVNGDEANSVCYVHARFVRDVPEGGNFFETTGYYDDLLVRTAGGWRIKHRVSKSNWMGGNIKVLQTMEGVTTSPPLTTLRREADADALMFLQALRH